MTKRYWNTFVFSLMAQIPNNQVTPRTGSNVPSDRKPDLFKEKVLLLLFLEKDVMRITIVQWIEPYSYFRKKNPSHIYVAYTVLVDRTLHTTHHILTFLDLLHFSSFDIILMLSTSILVWWLKSPKILRNMKEIHPYA